MRYAPLGTLILLFLAGCASSPEPEAREAKTARGGGAAPAAGFEASPWMEEWTVDVPNVVGPWAGAFWLESEKGLGCQYEYRWSITTQSGGTTDTILMIATGWDRPEVTGRIQHQFVRRDQYLGHVTAGPVDQDVRNPLPVANPGSGTSSGRTIVAFSLPPRAFIAVGSTYLPSADVVGPNQVPLALSVTCDGPFRMRAGVEGHAFRVYGAEEFDGGVQVDTVPGFAAQRGVTQVIEAREGLVALLHEDANNGNAQYTTTKPSGSQQVDTLGNRIALGPAGTWRFGLDRVSLSPGGEFRLFALDVAVPTLDDA